MPLPVMSGADPWTGSNMLGEVRSGLRLALAARPMLPVTMALRSVRMSPNRLLATTTSNASASSWKGVRRPQRQPAFATPDPFLPPRIIR